MRKAAVLLLLLSIAWAAAAGPTDGATADGDSTGELGERIFTVNTDPLVMCLGFYYVTLDIVLSDHLILANAIGFRNGRWALIPALRDDVVGISYTLGLAFFPFGNGARGFHLAGFVVPMLSFREAGPAFTPNLGAYAGYSFHLADAIKLSLKLGALYMIDDVTDPVDAGRFWPHVSFEVGYMF